MSLTSDTALAMAAVLASGSRVLASDLRQQVIVHGGDPEYILAGAKYLRDLGVPVVATKARHLTEWHIALPSDPDAGVDTEQWAIRVRREHYSEAVSTARALANSADPHVLAVRQTIVQSAINLGMQMGKSITQIVAECEVQTNP